MPLDLGEILVIAYTRPLGENAVKEPPSTHKETIVQDVSHSDQIEAPKRQDQEPEPVILIDDSSEDDNECDSNDCNAPKQIETSQNHSGHSSDQQQVKSGRQQNNCDNLPKKCSDEQNNDNKAKESDPSECRQVHNGRLQFFCDQCPARFSFKVLLNQHKQIHLSKKIPNSSNRCYLNLDHTYAKDLSKPKPFSCSKCSYRFTNTLTLKLHENMHFQEGCDEPMS